VQQHLGCFYSIVANGLVKDMAFFAGLPNADTAFLAIFALFLSYLISMKIITENANHITYVQKLN